MAEQLHAGKQFFFIIYLIYYLLLLKNERETEWINEWIITIILRYNLSRRNYYNITVIIYKIYKEYIHILFILIYINYLFIYINYVSYIIYIFVFYLYYCVIYITYIWIENFYFHRIFFKKCISSKNLLEKFCYFSFIKFFKKIFLNKKFNLCIINIF